MSSIQQVLNSVDLRRKIFNFKTQPKKKDWECEINDAKEDLIWELEYDISTLHLQGLFNQTYIPDDLTMVEFRDLYYEENEYVNLMSEFSAELTGGDLGYWLLKVIKRKYITDLFND